MIEQNDRAAPANQHEIVKEEWAKPEIIDYKPVIEAKGISFRTGDGISNLS